MTFQPIHGAEHPPPTAGGAAVAGAAPASPHGAHQPTDSVQLSAAAALMRQLDALVQASPARFQAVMVLVAARLASRAEAEPQRAQPLTQLAARFGAAAQAGSPAPLTAEPGAVARVLAAAELPAAARGLPPAASGTLAPGGAIPTTAMLAAAAMTGAAAKREPPRALGRAAYRPGRAGGPGVGPGAGEQLGGILGALLGAVTGAVEAAIDAALLEVPLEAEPGPGSTDRSVVDRP